MPIQDTSDFGLQQAQLSRRQQMADMLRKQSMEQSSGDMVSGHYIAPSWSQGLNKMAQALVGNKMQGEVDSGQKALADAVRGKTNEEWAGVTSDLAGREAIAQPEDGQQGPWMPAQAANPSAAYARALQSQDPNLKQFGMQGLAKMPEIQAQQQERVDNRAWRTQEAEAARAARAEELKVRMEDQRASQAERLQAQKELREMMIQAQKDTQRVIAANRPERQAQIIQTAEGPAQLVNGRAVPIIGADGKPVRAAATATGAEKPLTESQAKGSLYLGQMRTANDELDALETAKGTRKAQSIASPAAVAAAGSTWTNWATSPDAQKVSQLQSQWSEGFLRAKTGAAATEGEVKLNNRTFFPVVGDSEEVIKQKKKMRRVAEKDMEIVAGNGAKKAGGASGAWEPSADPKVNPIEALLDKYK